MIIHNLIQERLERVSPNIFIDGVQWYFDANEFCQNLSEEHRVPFRYVSGLTALFSPLKSWDMNQRLVRQWLDCQDCGTFGLQKTRALMLWKHVIENLKEDQQDNYIAKTLGGLKTQSFYHNITYPYTSDKVTIDSHIWKAFSKEKHITPKRYKEIEKAIQDVALKNQLLSPHLQAILWLQIKSEKEKNG